MGKIRKPLKYLSFFLVAALITAQPVLAAEPQWLTDAQRLAAAGIIDGDPLAFSPDERLTVAQAAVMLNRIVRLPDRLDRYFTDLEPNTEAEDAILRLAKAGILYVPPEGDMCYPDNCVSRQSAVVMLYELFQMEQEGAPPGWSDYGSVTAPGAINTFYAKGYIPEDMLSGNSFAPNLAVTRGQFAAMLCRVVSLFAGSENSPTATVNGNILSREPPQGMAATGKIYVTSGSGISDDYVVYINQTVDMLAKTSADFSQLLGTCTTDFGTGSSGRSTNVSLAAEGFIDGVLLKPGETFSFNNTVGVRSYERGFRTSTVFVGNNMTEGLGGGVCQVSSALFNAALNAGMTITERHPHSMAVSYVSPGLDATVSYGYLDFKFTNNIGVPVKITADANTATGILTVGIWATKYYGKPEIKVGATYKNGGYYGYRYIGGKLDWYDVSVY